jgi:hypothetical protein
MINVVFFTSWQIHTDGLRQLVTKALEDSEVAENDVVWCGPDGSAVVAASPADLEDTEYAEYTDSGMVAEYID